MNSKSLIKFFRVDFSSSICVSEFRISDVPILYNTAGPLINYVHAKFPYDPTCINKSSNYDAWGRSVYITKKSGLIKTSIFANNFAIPDICIAVAKEETTAI